MIKMCAGLVSSETLWLVVCCLLRVLTWSHLGLSVYIGLCPLLIKMPVMLG